MPRCNRCKEAPKGDCDAYISLNGEDSIRTCLLSTYYVFSAVLGSADMEVSKMLNKPIVDRLCSWERTADKHWPIHLKKITPRKRSDHMEVVRSSAGSAFLWHSLSEHPV